MRHRPEPGLPTSQLHLLKLSLLAACIATAAAEADRIDLVGPDAAWKYLDDGSEQYLTDPPFTHPDYDDSGWKTGSGRFGYGNGDEDTVVSYGADPLDKHAATYFRHEFQFDPASIGTTPYQPSILFHAPHGAVVYLNGAQVGYNIASLRNDLDSTRYSRGPFPFADRWVDVLLPLESLQSGRNVIAVGLHQSAADTPDLSFELQLPLLRPRFFQAKLVADTREFASNAGQIEPETVRAADFDGDGDNDIVLVNRFARERQITVAHNTDDGSFEAKSTVPSPRLSWKYLLTGNIDSHPLPDLVAVDENQFEPETVQAWINRSRQHAGQFELSYSGQPPIGSTVRDAELADIDGDGFDDLVTASLDHPFVAWAKCDGDGGFGLPRSVSFLLSDDVKEVETGDFDGDGHTDIAVLFTRPARLAWLRNTGNSGALSFPISIEFDAQSDSTLESADLDGDGRDELVVRVWSTEIAILAHDGTSFVEYPTRLYPTSNSWDLLTADLDGDGDIEIAVHDRPAGVPRGGGSRVRTPIWWDNEGGREFRIRHVTTTWLEDDFDAVWLPLATDLTGDDKPDFLAFNDRYFLLYENALHAPPRINTFNATPDIVSPSGEVQLSWDIELNTTISIEPPVTFNTDGLSATATVDAPTTFTLTASNIHGSTSRAVHVFATPPVFDFSSHPPLGAGGARFSYPAAADLDGQGGVDLFLVSRQDRLYWSPNQGGGGFDTLEFLYSFDSTFNIVGFADLDGNGLLDVVTYQERPRSGGERYVIFPSLPNGFGPPVLVPGTGTSNSKCVDVDGDGHADLLTANTKLDPGDPSSYTTVAYGRGDLTFEPAVPLTLQMREPQPLDLDSDGLLDLLGTTTTAPLFASGLHVQWNLGDRQFSDPQRLPTEVGGSDLPLSRAADVDGDGYADPVFISINDLYYLPHEGPRSFRLPRYLTRADNFEIGDIDGNGTPDIIYYDRSGLTQVRLSDGRGGFSDPLTFGEDLGLRTTLLHDIDGDGDLDALLDVRNEPIWLRNRLQPFAPPTIDAFDIAETEVFQGEPATLTWSVAGSRIITLDPAHTEITSADGTAIVLPLGDTTYTLHATNPNGTTSRSRSVSVVPSLRVTASGALTLDDPSCTLVQALTVENISPRTIGALSLHVANLPPGVRLLHAGLSGNLTMLQTLAPGETVTLELVYESPDLDTAWTPAVTPYAIPPADVGTDPPVVPDPIHLVRLQDGGVQLEFPSTPGGHYAIQYNDGNGWQTVGATKKATTSRTAWIDRGPPATDPAPADTRTRLYRVLQVPTPD